MAKKTPEARYNALVLEGFSAMKVSGEFRALREKWLHGRWKRRTQFRDVGTWWPKHEAWLARCPREDDKGDKSFWAFQTDVGQLTEKFNLAPWVVECAVFVRGFRPDPAKHGLVSEGFFPRIYIVTHHEDPELIKKLADASWSVGTPLVSSPGRLSVVHPPDKASPRTAFRVFVEFPPDYPPEAAAALARRAAQLGREALRCAGWPVKERLRPSSIVSKASELRLDQHRLASGDTYEILDRMAGGEEAATGAELRRKRKQVSSRRHKAKKHLAEMNLV